MNNKEYNSIIKKKNQVCGLTKMPERAIPSTLPSGPVNAIKKDS